MTDTLGMRPDLQEKVSSEADRRPRTSIGRSAARGAIGAMAMSGLRQFSTSLGMVEKVPPEFVLERTAPRMFAGVPVERRPVVVELVHWSFGAAGGALFGALPPALRARRLAGPLYGMAFWAAFETVVGPMLGLPRKEKRKTSERLALLADHLLYGMVVAASPWPHHDR
jgi:hypothetical protein